MTGVDRFLDKRVIAYFISPHGFGHASRSASVMEALYGLEPDIRFEIFTSLPCWFFEESVPCDFGFHPLVTDIGLIQASSLEEDISETVHSLERFLPFHGTVIKDFANQLKRLGCCMVVCDIAPLGIAVAADAAVPSVLVENFTWDWIYQGYAGQNGGLTDHIKYLEKIFRLADYHIQAEPVCCPSGADLTVSPMIRRTRSTSGDVRERLGLTVDEKAVLITMGGIPEQYPFLNRLGEIEEICFIISGLSEKQETAKNLRLLPYNSGIFHPDLLNACDAVIGKLGYSTLAEVYHAGLPYGYISRNNFPESKTLISFTEQNINGIAIQSNSFLDGEWISALPDLLSMGRIKRQGSNGAEQAAKFIINRILGEVKSVVPRIF